ncbi:hypothetical protein PV04_09127 [Phialophora macrospora]|uniref:Uncharacterized protein n=1 Tax=Phialophora macrospora TaxID=1851006 RepID=A0A0D2FW02_9EURO|nr:hypothetical protein PV04_09127 [Phialophora macrospora]
MPCLSRHMKNFFGKIGTGHDLRSDVPPPPPYEQLENDPDATTYSTIPFQERQQAQDLRKTDLPDLPPGEMRTLHVTYDNYWSLHTTIHVTTASTGNTSTGTSPTELYTIEARNRKPQMRIHAPGAPPDTEIATVDYHALKTRIEVTLRGRQFTLDSASWNRQYSYASAALGGEKMTWRPRSKIDDLKLVLLNARGVAIARFRPEYWGRKRGGVLELMPECWATDALMEEVLVMALAVINYKERQRLMACMSSVPAPPAVGT